MFNIGKGKNKNWFNKMDLTNKIYSPYYVMKVLGVKILSSKKMSDSTYVIIVNVPERYECGFFEGITSKDVVKFINKKIKDELPTYKIQIILAYSNDKLKIFWTEMDYYKMKHIIVSHDITKFKQLLDNNGSIKVTVKKK